MTSPTATFSCRPPAGRWRTPRDLLLRRSSGTRTAATAAERRRRGTGRVTVHGHRGSRVRSGRPAGQTAGLPGCSADRGARHGEPEASPGRDAAGPALRVALRGPRCAWRLARRLRRPRGPRRTRRPPWRRTCRSRGSSGARRGGRPRRRLAEASAAAAAAASAARLAAAAWTFSIASVTASGRSPAARPRPRARRRRPCCGPCAPAPARRRRPCACGCGCRAAGLRTRRSPAAALARHRLAVHVVAAALAGLAGLAEDLEQALADALAGHLHEAERGDLGDLVLGAVAAQALEQAAQHEVAVALEHHVDEVDDDDAADVAQPELADDLLGRLEVVAGDGLLEVAALTGELAGVDVDDGHRLGAVDDQRAARGQPHLAVERLGELLVDAVLA